MDINNKGAPSADFVKARQELADLGMTLHIVETPIGNRYRVNYAIGGAESSAYYTDDLDDALSTGKAMRNIMD